MRHLTLFHSIQLGLFLILAVVFGLLLKFLYRQTGHQILKIATFIYLTVQIFGILSDSFFLISDFATDGNLTRTQMIYFWIFQWSSLLTGEIADWYFCHMYFVRVNEIKYLYLYGIEHAKKRQFFYNSVFWIVLCFELGVSLILLTIWIA